jgi:membrane complex biogenesis BtpA family protein
MTRDIVDLMNSGKKVSIGMVHTLPLPGSYRGVYSMDEIIRCAVKDARALEDAGFDAVIVENLNDGPYEDGAMDTRKIAALSRVCSKVRDAISLPIGIDSCGDQLAGFGIGCVNGVTFIRLSYMVDLRVGAKGIVMPNAGNAVMLRRRLGAEDIRILADIQVKHTYPVFKDIGLEESAGWAMANMADALIVTGSETGKAASLEDLKRVKRIAKVPVIAGSGVDQSNVGLQYAVCDGSIVGTSLKATRNVADPIDAGLAQAFMKAVRASGY